MSDVQKKQYIDIAKLLKKFFNVKPKRNQQ